MGITRTYTHHLRSPTPAPPLLASVSRFFSLVQQYQCKVEPKCVWASIKKVTPSVEYEKTVEVDDDDDDEDDDDSKGGGARDRDDERELPAKKKKYITKKVEMSGTEVVCSYKHSVHHDYH